MTKRPPSPWPTVACGLLACVTLHGKAAAQVPAGPEFRVNTYINADQTYARPAIDTDGRFIILWNSDGQDGSFLGVFGQRFDATGARVGTEFRVNTNTLSHQHRGVTAFDAAGRSVIVWSGASDGDSLSVQAQRYDAAGRTVGAEFVVNAFTTGAQFGPDAGASRDGHLVVVWTSDLIDGGGRGIAARRFDASGAPVGSEFLVNTYTTGTQTSSSIAVQPDGSFVIVWSDLGRNAPLSAVIGRRYDAHGDPIGDEFVVAAPSAQSSPALPSVSTDPEGAFVVAWTGGDGNATGTFARRFDPSGSPIGSDFLVNTYTTGGQFGFSAWRHVAADGRGNFIVTWSGQRGDDVEGSFIQRFSASGVRRGAEVRVNTFTTGPQQRSSIASDEVGNFVVTWQSQNQDGSGYGIFAQRFGGLSPAALSVDTPGNQVLEPGEAVDVRPVWRNVNGSAQTFDGALLEISGPPGAGYSITDASGGYGTVPNGASGPCTDCYSVSVSDPATRPAAHWDAVVVETIVPDTHGQQKSWRLHIGRSFSDVAASSPFYRFVETILHEGVTGGCAPEVYCPLSSTTRAQMAVFVLVSKEAAGYTPPACVAGSEMFADVPASDGFCRWIEELARRGIVGGCSPGLYCPMAPATREQMAVFVLRALDPTLTPPPCGAPMFADVPPTSGFCRWIEELARRGVVTGCGGGNYCPATDVSREQMSVFLTVTFGLKLYGP